MKNKITFVIASLVILTFIIRCDYKRKENINKFYSDPYPAQKLNKFIPLPVGAVQARGWLRKELQAWAEGITGHLQEYRGDAFWNTWDNRKFRNEHPNAIGDQWWYFEHQAYWADGLIQLAYELDDQRLKKIANEFVDKVLAGQNNDGYFGGWPDSPYSNDGDIYTQSQISLAMLSYHSATNDPRILPALQKAYRHIYLNCKPVPGTDGLLPLAWRGGSYGWPSASHIIYPVFQVYSKTGDKQLLELAELIYKTGQEITSMGRNGRRSDIQVKNLLLNENTVYDMHGVDGTEVMRIPAVHYLLSGNIDDLDASIRGIDKIERYCQQAHGAPSADEQLREPGSTNCTESCTQTTWSATKQTLFAVTGNVHYADGVEKIIYNIGPGSRKPDGKAMQYYSAPNQAACTSISNRSPLTLPNRHSFCPDGDFRTLCCIGESNRLYPNFVKDAMWLASMDNGLAGACYGPSKVSAKVGKKEILSHIEEKTNYPFEEKIRFEFSSGVPVKFPLYLRIPGWCDSAIIKINGQIYENKSYTGQNGQD